MAVEMQEHYGNPDQLNWTFVDVTIAQKWLEMRSPQPGLNCMLYYSALVVALLDETAFFVKATI